MGGGTDYLSLGTELETSAPFFGHRQPLVLPSQNLKHPLFMEAQGTVPTNCHFWINLFDLILLNYLFLEQLLMHTFII